MSGANFSGARLRETRFVECKLDDANFRMAVGEHVAFDGSVMINADFYAAAVPGTVFGASDLTGVEFSKCNLAGGDLRGSRLDGLKGAIDLTDVSIDSAQMIPLALSMFAARAIKIVSDDDADG
jgi:uncharacterized protein YjbI with pentapeptide repeats